MANRKLVVVPDKGVLPELNRINGPILAPTRITLDTIQKMLTNGRRVFECCPTDPRNEDLRIQLTLENYKNDNFATGAAPQQPVTPPVTDVPPVEPPVQEPTSEETSEGVVDNSESDVPEEQPVSESETAEVTDVQGKPETVETSESEVAEPVQASETISEEVTTSEEPEVVETAESENTDVVETPVEEQPVSESETAEAVKETSEVSIPASPKAGNKKNKRH